MGNVIDNANNRPVEFATVNLIRLPDSTVSSTTVTDKKGKFFFEKADSGNYVISSTFIGYEISLSSPFSLTDSTSTYAVPSMRLFTAAKLMTEVTVTGRRAQLNTSIDRKIYNVEQDIMSKSGSVSDVLKNIPSVEVDVEGGVSLRGSGDVMILINGKPNPLMGRTKAEVLQQLPANSVERIEVITNPSARYRPDGTSGIINIVLKKNIKHGFNGSVTANVGNKTRYNSNVTMNLRPGKFNLFGSYGFRQDTRQRFNEQERIYLDSATKNVTSYFNQSASVTAYPLGHFANGGIDITPDERNSFGGTISYFTRDLVWRDNTTASSFDAQRNLISQFNRTRREPELEDEVNGMVYYQHSFGKEEHEIRAEFNIADEKEQEFNYFTTNYTFPSLSQSKENNFLKTLTNEKQLTIDYTNPFSEDAKLEAGYDGFSNKNDFDLYREFFDQTMNRFIRDSARSNRFKFDENVHALYATYQKAYEKFGYQFGIRGESVNTKSYLVTFDSLITNNYFKIYPTLHLSYQVNDQHELQLNYSKRINRPDGDELNPFPEYQDPRNLRAGNPKLLPEIIHSVEFGWKWQHKDFSFVPGIYYRMKTDGFTSVLIPLNDTTVLTTEQNLSKDRSAGLELIFTYKKGKFYTGTLSTNLFYNQIDASNLGYFKNNSIYSASVSFINNFNLSPGTVLQLNSNFRSARLTPQGKTFPSVVVNSGIRQDLAQGKLSMTLTASDIFSSNRRREELDLPYLRQNSLSRRDGLVVYFGMSWRFGVIKKKKEEKLEFDDSLN